MLLLSTLMLDFVHVWGSSTWSVGMSKGSIGVRFVATVHHWDASRDKGSNFLLNVPSLQHVSQYSQVSINSEQKSAIIQEELRLKESNSEKAPMSGFSASN